MPAAVPAKPAGLSVFFPAYNDSGTIASMVIRTVQTASKLTPDFEVIVVDDGSADGTPGTAAEPAGPPPPDPPAAAPRKPPLRSPRCTIRSTATTAPRCKPAFDPRPRS